MYYVYKITNLVNGKIYIGKTNNIKARWNKHLSTAKNKNSKDYSYIHRAMSKYLFENFKIESIAEFEIEDQALAMEIEVIAKLNSTNRNVGYNISHGGDRGMTGLKHTEETKAKISKANTGKNPSQEARKKMSEAHRGSKRTEETKNKMREARKKQAPMSEETKRKISFAKKGIKHTQDWKCKNSFRNRGERNNSAILTEADVIEIRRLKASGVKRAELLRIYNKVAAGTMDNVIYGQSWIHLLISSESSQEQGQD